MCEKDKHLAGRPLPWLQLGAPAATTKVRWTNRTIRPLGCHWATTRLRCRLLVKLAGEISAECHKPCVRGLGRTPSLEQTVFSLEKSSIDTARLPSRQVGKPRRRRREEDRNRRWSRRAYGCPIQAFGRHCSTLSSPTFLFCPPIFFLRFFHAYLHPMPALRIGSSETMRISVPVLFL